MVIPERWLKHLTDREGSKEMSYEDSLGHLTGGVGHKLTKEERDEYTEGTLIPESVRNRWLAEDSTGAYNAAIKQADELKYQNQNMIEALASVNFQLGTSWRKKFPSAWEALKKGKYDEAIRQVKYNKKEPSKWSTQTPKRTNDFISAIEQLKSESTNIAGDKLVEQSKKKDSDQKRAENGVFKKESEANATLSELSKSST